MDKPTSTKAWDKRKPKHALDSAAKPGFTAPSIAHMWHMPRHIYSNLHRYEDAAWHQQASARVDHAQMLRHRLLPDQVFNYAHNNEWLSRNWMNLGNRPAALEMAKSLLSNPRHPKLNSVDGKEQSYAAPADFGDRPDVNTLNPIHWEPPSAPAFTLPDQKNLPVSLEEYRGKPLVLIFDLGYGCLHCTEIFLS